MSAHKYGIPVHLHQSSQSPVCDLLVSLLRQSNWQRQARKEGLILTPVGDCGPSWQGSPAAGVRDWSCRFCRQDSNLWKWCCPQLRWVFPPQSIQKLTQRFVRYRADLLIDITPSQSNPRALRTTCHWMPRLGSANILDFYVLSRDMLFLCSITRQGWHIIPESNWRQATHFLSSHSKEEGEVPAVQRRRQPTMPTVEPLSPTDRWHQRILHYPPAVS